RNSGTTHSEGSNIRVWRLFLKKYAEWYSYIWQNDLASRPLSDEGFNKHFGLHEEIALPKSDLIAHFHSDAESQRNTADQRCPQIPSSIKSFHCCIIAKVNARAVCNACSSHRIARLAEAAKIEIIFNFEIAAIQWNRAILESRT